MKNQIEKTISEFITNNYNKDFAKSETDIGNGWTLHCVAYDVDGTMFTDVLLTHPDLEPTLMCGTVRVECEIAAVADVCEDMIKVPVK